LRIAAIIVILLVPGWFLFRYVSAPEQILLSAETGTLACNLPDGSVVTLNKGATIEYPQSFTGKTRQVKITGEACFEVSRDEAKPFIVQIGGVRVEVLGTVFYVKEDMAAGHVSVILASGSVATYFKAGNKNKVILQPGEAAEISLPEHTIEKHAADDPNMLAWKTRHMEFENTPLQEIVTLLNDVYQARILLADPKLAGCRVTATFDQQSLESVLAVLQATLGITTENTSEGIVISGRTCE
jgi:ferric-dicitrate binding protein FerR (iron transport regulator)